VFEAHISVCVCVCVCVSSTHKFAHVCLTHPACITVRLSGVYVHVRACMWDAYQSWKEGQATQEVWTHSALLLALALQPGLRPPYATWLASSAGAEHAPF